MRRLLQEEAKCTKILIINISRPRLCCLGGLPRPCIIAADPASRLQWDPPLTDSCGHGAAAARPVRREPLGGEPPAALRNLASSAQHPPTIASAPARRRCKYQRTCCTGSCREPASWAPALLAWSGERRRPPRAASAAPCQQRVQRHWQASAPRDPGAPAPRRRHVLNWRTFEVLQPNPSSAHQSKACIIGCANGPVAVKLFQSAADPRAVLRREVTMGLFLNELRLRHVVKVYGYTASDSGPEPPQQLPQQQGQQLGQEAEAAQEQAQAEGQGEQGAPEAARYHAIVMECCALGSLKQLIRKLAGRWGCAACTLNSRLPPWHGEVFRAGDPRAPPFCCSMRMPCCSDTSRLCLQLLHVCLGTLALQEPSPCH